MGRIIVWRLKSALKDRSTPPQPDPGSSRVLSQADILEAQRAFADTYPNILETMANQSGTGWNDFIDTTGEGVVNASDDPQVMAVTVRMRWRREYGAHDPVLLRGHRKTLIGGANHGTGIRSGGRCVGMPTGTGDGS